MDKKSFLGKVFLTKNRELSVFRLGKKLGLPKGSQLFFFGSTAAVTKKAVGASWLCIGDLYLDDLGEYLLKKCPPKNLEK